MSNYLRDEVGDRLEKLGHLTQKLVRLDEALVRSCDSPQRGYRMVMEESGVGMSQEDWATSVGMNPSQFKQCISLHQVTPKYMPPEAEERLHRVAGNLGMAQWRELFREDRLYCQRRREDRIAQLKAELAREEAALAG